MRHGETVWNAERRFTTRSDVPLSEAGLEQARRAAHDLSATAIDRIYASPMQRAVRTAELVAEQQTDPPALVADQRLVEIDAGPFEGRTPQEIEASGDAAAFHAWHTDGEPVFPSGTESFEDALQRAASFLDEHGSEPGTTLVVTHGSLARLMVASHLLGGPPPLHRRLWLDNCRLAVIEHRDGIPKLVGFNVSRAWS
jgi:probable phosphoglycerate mutase